MTRINAERLCRSLETLLAAGGLNADKARVVAEVLVEADMIGHATHGTGLVAGYLDALANGELIGHGEPEVIADRGACVTWDGRKLPGPWLIRNALDLACNRVASYGTVTVAIRNSHHTGALAAYMRRVTDLGYVVQINCSTVSAARMAPFGGTEAVLTPNPQAYGFPTDGDPILIDISASITTTTMTRQLAAAGRRYPEPWALTAQGQPTDDPEDVISRGGTLMAIGGVRKGYKGFGMALAVDLLSQGLAGSGRADEHPPMTVSVFLQVLDPSAFSGADAFRRQSSHTARLCRENRPAPGVDKVRVPGDAASASRRRALVDGVEIDDTILGILAERARGLGVSWLE